MKQTIDEDWKGYVEKNSNRKQKFDFWGLDRISDMVDDNIITHTMFSQNELSLFRKTLALIEDNEYDLIHFEYLIDSLLSVNKLKTQISVVRTLRLCILLQNIVFKWCEDINNLKNAYLASEMMILKASNFIIDNEWDVKKNIWIEFLNLFISRLAIGFNYVEKVKPQFEIPYRLGEYSNGVEYEYPLICFEQIGIVAQIGLEHMHLLSMSSQNMIHVEPIKQRIKIINNALCDLLKNNTGVHFPQFDEHLIDISISLDFFYKVQNFEAGSFYLEKLIYHLIKAWKYMKFFPLFRADFDELNLIWGNGQKAKTSSSHLILVLAEWCLCFGYIGGYRFLSKCCGEKGIYKNINLQMWIPDENTEKHYCDTVMPPDSGTVIFDYELPNERKKYIDRIIEEKNKFNFYQYNSKLSKLSFLASLVSRRFRRLPLPIIWRKYIFDPAKNVD